MVTSKVIFRGGSLNYHPIAWADEKMRLNNRSLLTIGLISFVLVSITLLIMFNTLVVSRLDRLSTAIKSFPENRTG